MNLYLDTSALLKQYFQEAERDEVKARVARASGLFTSVISYAEARGALARAERGGRLAAEEHALALREFESDWRGYTTPDATATVTRLAGELAAKHFLRGLDAIHLASALVLQEALAEPVAFLAFDERLMAAAGEEGLGVRGVSGR